MSFWSRLKRRVQERRNRTFNEPDAAGAPGMQYPRPRITQLDADLAKDASPQQLREPGADDTYR